MTARHKSIRGFIAYVNPLSHDLSPAALFICWGGCELRSGVSRRGANELHVLDFVLGETAPGARIMLTDTPLDNIFLPFIWLWWPKQECPCAVGVGNKAATMTGFAFV